MSYCVTDQIISTTEGIVKSGSYNGKPRVK